MSAAFESAPARADGAHDRSFLIPATLLLWLAGLSFPAVATTRNLDTSWATALAEIFKHGMKAGTEIVFTYGPLALGSFHPDTFWFSYAFEVTLSALIAVVCARFAAMMPSLPSRIIALVALLIATTTPETRYFAFAVILGVLQVKSHDWSPLRLAWTMGCLALVGLLKFTFLALGVGLTLLVPLAAEKPRWRPVLLAPALFAGWFALFWLLAAQPLQNIPSYLVRSLEIASGYSEAMSMPGNGLHNNLALQLHVLFVLSLLSRPDIVKLRQGRIGVAIVALGLFMAWKQGFVRQDYWHFISYFGFVVLCPVALLALAPIPPGPLAPLSWAIFGVTAISAYGAYLHVAVGGPRHGDMLAATLARLGSSHSCLLGPLDCETGQSSTYRAAREAWQLPRIREAVGSASIDLVSHDQLALFANELNWRPRPIFQSYSAYTEELAKLNGDFLRGPRAPEFIMANWGTIDGRFLQHDDGQVVLEVLRRYRPVLEENGFLLLKKRPTIDRGTSDGAIVFRINARFGQSIHLPEEQDGLYTLQIHFRYSLMGRIRRIAFRSPPLWFHASVSNGEQKKYRIIPSLARSEFLISPLMEWNGDLISIYDRKPARRLVSLRFLNTKAGEDVYHPEFEIILRRYPFP
jgi:hypothetical protein